MVVSENVGEGGPGDPFRFDCEFVVIEKGRKGRDLDIFDRLRCVGGSWSGEWDESAAA